MKKQEKQKKTYDALKDKTKIHEAKLTTKKEELQQLIDKNEILEDDNKKLLDNISRLKKGVIATNKTAIKDNKDTIKDKEKNKTQKRKIDKTKLTQENSINKRIRNEIEKLIK